MTSSSGESASTINAAKNSSNDQSAVDKSVAEGSSSDQSEKSASAGDKAATYSSEDLSAEYAAQAKSDYSPVPVNLQNLLDAGAHFGHQIRRWNPKMMPYIFGERNGVHIINLDLTLDYWARAIKFIEDLANRGGNILFVGTKLQARDIVKEAAQRAGAYSVTQRWLGGTLSNFETIKRSISRMKKLEELLKEAQNEDSKIKLNKKERLSISRDLTKLEANLGGIRDMKRLPDALFIVDIAKESIAVAEARNLQIPVVALVDTNVNPTLVDFPIPSNDDAARTLRLFVDGVADAFAEGRASFLARGARDENKGNQKSESDSVVPSANKKGGSRKSSGPAGKEASTKEDSSSEKDKQESIETPAAAN